MYGLGHSLPKIYAVFDKNGVGHAVNIELYSMVESGIVEGFSSCRPKQIQMPWGKIVNVMPRSK